MAQYDPIAAKNGILTVLGTDTLRDDRIAVAGLDTTTNSLASGDVVQVDAAALRMKKAVNTSTSPIVGVYDGISGSVVRRGVVVATFKSGLTLANGDAVYLSLTAGALTNVKPTKDMLHEVGVVVDAANSKILLQQKPVIALPASPPLSVWLATFGTTVYQVLSPSGSVAGTATVSNLSLGVLWDGDYIWTANNDNPAKVEKVDPTTRAVVGGPWTLGYLGGGPHNAYLMAFDGTNYWIKATNSLVKFDGSGNNLGTVSTSGNILGIAYSGQGYVLVPHQASRTLHRVNTATNAVTSTTTTHAHGFNGVVVGGYYYLPTFEGGSIPVTPYLTTIRLSDMVETNNVSMTGINFPELCVSDGTYLYIIDNDNALEKRRLSDGGREWRISISAYNVIYDGLYVWTSYSSSSEFNRVDPADGSKTKFAITSAPRGLATTKAPLPWV